MKKVYDKLSEMQKMLFLSAFIAVILMLFALLPLFLANQPGWLIGIVIGSVIEIINIFLLYKASESALKTFKASIFLGLYFLRMLLYLAGFVVTAFLGFGFHWGSSSFEAIGAFNYSIWGVLIAYTPAQIVLVFVMVHNKKNPVTISEDNIDKKE